MVGIAVSVSFHFSLRFWERGRQIAPLDLSPRFEPKPFPGTSLDSLLQRYGVEAWEPPPAAAPQDFLTPPEAPTQESTEEPTQAPTQEPATPEQPRIEPGVRRPVVVPNRERLNQLFSTEEPEGNDPDTAPRRRPTLLPDLMPPELELAPPLPPPAAPSF